MAQGIQHSAWIVLCWFSKPRQEADAQIFCLVLSKADRKKWLPTFAWKPAHRRDFSLWLCLGNCWQLHSGESDNKADRLSSQISAQVLCWWTCWMECLCWYVLPQCCKEIGTRLLCQTLTVFQSSLDFLHVTKKIQSDWDTINCILENHTEIESGLVLTFPEHVMWSVTGNQSFSNGSWLQLQKCISKCPSLWNGKYYRFFVSIILMVTYLFAVLMYVLENLLKALKAPVACFYILCIHILVLLLENFYVKNKKSKSRSRLNFCIPFLWFCAVLCLTLWLQWPCIAPS